MDISPEQTRQFIQELQALRNQRLSFILTEGILLEDLLADLSNALEVFYVIQRAIHEQAILDKVNEIRKLCEDRQAAGVNGERVDVDTIWPSEVLDILSRPAE